MESIGYSLIAISLLLAANAFFVAAEFALVRVRSFQLVFFALSFSCNVNRIIRIKERSERRELHLLNLNVQTGACKNSIQVRGSRANTVLHVGDSHVEYMVKEAASIP